jgi:hypothetical protein
LLRRSVLVWVLVLASPAPSASAADPIMPLAEVRPGMRCTGLSVVRGTEIASFDVEILDVIAQEAGLTGPRILVRTSGPAVAESGMGLGFSGSPIMCGGRNAGAISEALGEYGNDVVLATPIEEILSDRPAPVTRATPDRRLARAARPLAAPLMVSGLSTHTRRLLARAAEHAGRTVLTAPAGPLAGYAPVDLQPGASVAVGLSTGDIALGALGTVAYRDGTSVWAFGHPFEDLGRRSLFMQDSYVYGVISNPLGAPVIGALSYKLASGGGHAVGSVTSDTVASVAGALGPEPASIPLRVVARGASGRLELVELRLADERALGYGARLGLLSPLAASQALDRLIRARPPLTLSMCMRFRIGGRRRALGFCNPYFNSNAALTDLSQAGELVDSFDLAPLDIQQAEVRLRARSGVVEDVLVDADGPRRARPGQRIRLRLVVKRRRGGGRRRLSGSVRLPAALPPGRHALVLRGSAGSEFPFDELAEELGVVIILLGGGSEGGEPASVRALARALRRMRRPLGIEARLKRRRLGLVVRSDDVKYEGEARLSVRIGRERRAARRGPAR